MIKILISTLFSFMLINVSAESIESSQDMLKTQRQLGTHVHGLAELTVAQNGQQLELHLESPAANIVGFEHKASTHEQEHAIEKAKSILESPQKLFIFSGTRCDVINVDVNVSALLSHHEKSHHEDTHEHESEKEHYDEYHQDAHNEITALYQFNCLQGSKLETISVALLEQFTGIEKLKAMWVTEATQGTDELSLRSKIIHLRK